MTTTTHTRRALLAAAAATAAATITGRIMIVGFEEDDLGRLLAPNRRANQRSPGLGPLSFGQGVLLSWDRLTGANTVNYRGAVLRDLPIANSLESLLLKKDDVVGILSAGGQYFILGRITRPGASAYGDSLAAIRDLEADATGSVTTLSTSFVSLTGGPAIGSEIFVGPSGRLEITASAWLSVATTGAGGNSQTAVMSFELRDAAGSVVRAPADVRAVSITIGGGAGGGISAGSAQSRKVLLTGLTPGGGYSVEAKYRAGDAAQLSAGFTNRVISAVAL